MIIIMYIYRALINALSAHIILINLNVIFYTHVEHSPMKNNLRKVLYGHTHTHTHTHRNDFECARHWSVSYIIHARAQAHTHTHTHAHTHTDYDCSRNWVNILVGAKILWEEEGFQFGLKDDRIEQYLGSCGSEFQKCAKAMNLAFVFLSPFLIGRMFLREPSWKYSAKLFWFLIGPTFLREPSWKYSSKLYSGPKSFAQHVLGTLALLDDHCLWLAESRALLWMKKKKTKIKMDDRVARFFTRFVGNLFICWLVGGAALSRRPRLR